MLIGITSENNPLTRQISIQEPHYPGIYNDIIKLCGTMGGKVVLVAGEVFGKIYCNAVKNAGGVAIDIGSMLDSWMGFKTR